MCDDQDIDLQKTLQSIAARVPKIVLQRAEEIFPAVKQIMNRLDSQEDVPASHTDACSPPSLSGIQAVKIKVEEVSDMECGEDPVPMTVVGIKAEREEDVPGSHSEACSSLSTRGVQAVNIKVEEFSDMEGGEDPVPMTVVGLKAEHEGCAHPQKDIPGSCSDTCPTTAHDAFQAISIKVEEFSDVEEVEDPLLISFPGIKAEHAVVLNEHQLIHNEYPYPCDVDNKSFTRSSRLKRRQRIRAAARSFSCDVCNKTFNRQGHLKEHQRIHSGERPYSCHVCSKSFNQHNHLKGHERIHTGERPYACDVCKKSFSRRSYLKAHQYIHSGKRAFSCAVCNKSFTTNNVLTIHKRIHSEERPFSCSLCNKSYVTKNQLKVHLRKHSGQRPFVCDVCNKSYTTSSDLKVHQRIHSGERPFSCDMCNKSFITNSHLKAHQRIHSGERPFSCDICNKSFIANSYLKAHQRIHTGERPFPCDIVQ